jgi:CBS domain-containing protein
MNRIAMRTLTALPLLLGLVLPTGEAIGQQAGPTFHRYLDPVTVKPDDQLEGCMAMMSARGFRHLPVLAGKVVGVISIGDVVKDIIRNLEHNVGDLMGYIMTDGPRG